MDKQERKNWEKVRAALAAAGKTDCYFYKRADAICDGKPDPMDKFK